MASNVFPHSVAREPVNAHHEFASCHPHLLVGQTNVSQATASRFASSCSTFDFGTGECKASRSRWTLGWPAVTKGWMAGLEFGFSRIPAPAQKGVQAAPAAVWEKAT